MGKKLILIMAVMQTQLMLYADNMEKIFNRIYETNHWQDKESVSGSGSNLQQTAIIRREIPLLLKKLKIKSMLDAPCGDFNWMKDTSLSFLKRYIGGDIVPKLIEKNQKKYSSKKQEFMVLNVVTDLIPKVDIIFCRDLLVHFHFEDILKALKNLKKSGAKYLLTTTFTERTKNFDIKNTGDWRPINLELPPFNLPKPIAIINEGCTEGNGAFLDKSLGLWELKALPD